VNIRVGAEGRIGARALRVEDARILLGRTRYVADVHLPGALALSFVRSPYAHARIDAILVEEARSAPGVHAVLTAADLPGLLPDLRYDDDPETGRPPCRSVIWPPLASGKVRFVGEAYAVVAAESRALAEDAAARVDAEWEPLEPVVDPLKAAEPGGPRVHEEWPDNRFQTVEASFGGVDEAFRGASHVVAGTFRSGRHLALPLEGRGVVAHWDENREELKVWISTQMPHVVRSEVAGMVGVPESAVRVIARDVGGGFGLKAHVFPEELLTVALARHFGRPVEWIEDRRENLTASQHARDQVVRAELALDSDGTMRGLRAHVVADIGAYTEYPWPTFEANVTAMSMPGPHRLPAYAYETVSVATNKCSVGAYRGVGQPIGVFVMERLVDTAAERLGIDRFDLRRRNMIPRDSHPYTTVMGTEIESGSHRECLDRALETIDAPGIEARCQAAIAQGRRRGLGVASYVEVTAPDARSWQMLGPRTGGVESALVRIEPDGHVVVALGVNSQGQSHETVFAQIAADRLGVPLGNVRVVQGDTARTPRGWVTGGSKSAVATGGAVLRASDRLRGQMLAAASHLVGVSVNDLDLRDGGVYRNHDGSRVLDLSDVARAILLNRIPVASPDEVGLEVTAHYEPPPLTHSNATHAVEIEVDVETGQIEITRYVVAEDCGTLLNPAVVDGQIRGGVAQGIGGALLEEIRYDEDGQLLTGTLMDYLVPTADDVPRIEIEHLETPSPHTEGGIKGVGEGGTIAPPAALANALADALRDWSPQVDRLPLTPERVLAIVERNQEAKRERD